MKGTILKPWTSGSLYGVNNFLEMWQDDPLRAISECLMGDRDSYPGQYIHMLIESGFLLAQEVEGVCIEWLTQARFKEKNGQLGLDEVLSMPRGLEPKFSRLASFIASHFDELYVQVENTWSEGRLIGSASLAEDMSRSTWGTLDSLFKAKYWNDLGLFDNLYMCHSFATSFDREQRLQFVAKMARCQKRAYGGNDQIISTMRHMLRRHFGYTYKRTLGDPNLFGITQARIEKWLASQNAYMPAR